MSQERKPPARANVVALKGGYKPRRVTQARLQELRATQDAQMKASQYMTALQQEIAIDLAHDAEEEAGPLYFDRDRRMAREVRKDKTG